MKPLDGTAKVLVKIVDYALQGTFVTAYLLCRLRCRFQSKALGSHDKTRLLAEWAEAQRTRDALQHEVDYPGASRLFESDVMLKNSLTLAQAKCRYLMVAIRAHRKAACG